MQHQRIIVLQPCAPAEQQQQPKQQGTDPAQQQQQSGMAVAQPFILLQASPQQLLQLQQIGFVALAPPGASVPTPAITSRAVAKPRRVAKKVQEPRVSRHANSICANCYTTETTLWRRSISGQPECNSCNLYWHKKGVPRPPEMAGKKILSRKRVRPAETGGSSSLDSATIHQDHLGSTSGKKARSSVPPAVAEGAYPQGLQPVPDGADLEALVRADLADWLAGGSLSDDDDSNDGIYDDEDKENIIDKAFEMAMQEE